MALHPYPDRVAPRAPLPPAAHRLVRWSWGMLPLLVPSFVLAYGAGTLLMHALGVPETDLLSTTGVAGWLAALLVLAVAVAPLAAGVLLARRALRVGAGRAALVPLFVNGLLLAWLLLSTFLQLAFA